jgi:hypothetical protein
LKFAILAASVLTLFTTDAMQAARAEENGKISLETGLNYNTGKYGGTQSSDILYLPFTGKYQNNAWTLKLTVPYLRISGPINVVNGVGSTGIATNTVSTRSGLGDVIAAVTYNTYNSVSSRLFINLTGKVKFGTASSSHGLGTGKSDYSFQSEIFRLAGKLTPFGIIGYTVYGKPAGYTLNNGSYGSLGGSYRFDSETSGGAMLDASEKISPAGSSRLSVIFFASHKLEKNWKAQGYILKGFTNSVPSWGVGATIALTL